MTARTAWSHRPGRRRYGSLTHYVRTLLTTLVQLGNPAKVSRWKFDRGVTGLRFHLQLQRMGVEKLRAGTRRTKSKHVNGWEYDGRSSAN